VVEDVIFKLQWSTRDIRSKMDSNDLIYATYALRFYIHRICPQFIKALGDTLIGVTKQS
jgi:hypothetical protein